MSEARERFCGSCGNPSPPDARFCRECGAILVRGGSPGPSDTPFDALAPPPVAPGPPTREGGRRWIAWAAILVLAVLAGLAALVLLGRRPPPEIPVPGLPPASATATPEARATPMPSPTAAVEATPRRVDTSPPAGSAALPTEPVPRAAPTPLPSPAAHPGGIERGIGGRAVERPGWYRMRFRAPLFREPSETSPIVTYLPRGTRIHVVRTLPGFLRVESVRGKAPGYVSSDDAVPEARGPAP